MKFSKCIVMTDEEVSILEDAIRMLEKIAEEIDSQYTIEGALELILENTDSKGLLPNTINF